MLDNKEINQILEKLENLEDEQLAVKLLGEFNRLTSMHGKLLLNKDNNLNHEEWKKACDELAMKINLLAKEIQNL